MRSPSAVATLVAAAALLGAVVAVPAPLFAWSSHAGPAVVNLSTASIDPYGDAFTLWTWRSQLAVVDEACNIAYVMGLNRTFDGKTHGAYVLGTNLTSGAIVARVPAPLLDAGGIFGGGMALGLMPPTAPGVCASTAVVSGFSVQDSSVLIVTTLPLGASAHPQAVQCKVPGYVPQNSFSAPPQSPGFFASAAQRLVISVDRAEDGAPCWLSVHLPTCSAQCIPARLPVPWAGAGARGTLATVHSLPGSSIGVGLGHVTFPNGSSFLVGGWLNASDAGGATLLPSSRRALAPWPSTFQSLSAFDAESGVLYWPGYDGGGNALVATRLPGDPVDPTGTWASHAIGHFCQDHTDDFAGQGCPYAMFTGSHPRDGAWA